METGPDERQRRRRAANNVRSAMHDRGIRSNAALAKAAKIDQGTVGDFLNLVHWPTVGNQTAIEKALHIPIGSIQAWYDDIDLPTAESSTELAAEMSDIDLARKILDMARELVTRLGG